MIVRFLAVLAALFSISAAQAATWDVWATLTSHNLSCSNGVNCSLPERGVVDGLKLNQPKKAILTITEYMIDVYAHQKYSLIYEGGGMGDSTENYFNDFSLSLSWNGDSGSMGYSYDHVMDFYYETARIELTTLAPIPLPSAAAFMPFAIAALALFRKRRKNT